MPSFSFRSLFAVWFLLQSVCPATVWGQATNTPSKKTLSKEEKAALLQKYGPVPVANQYPLINTSREQMDFSQGGGFAARQPAPAPSRPPNEKCLFRRRIPNGFGMAA